ncbi:hypothetical protein T552_03002 [Pneumocystis carinii B80]|uniref:Helicase ATP-binding domain-containing protein n=1 Tax=Pneumocystis carinii (strain B80) TaxID=1408658 RepID=A0A0W4ZCN1_PNEC8|nr:hypothetical protein T552_03002 [Pneumocystis carinii B80]KTW26108.1 hypothetical protein T552_03002 [Pneumocystis carinii B80]
MDRDSLTLQLFDLNLFKHILIDEVHYAAIVSYICILRHFSALNSDIRIIVIGISATIFRLNGFN